MKIEKAYSLLTIKNIDEGKRIIRGIATTPTPDRSGDVVNPLGVSFKNPLPLLYHHNHQKPVGTVIFDKPTKKGVTFTATIIKVEEEGDLKQRVDTAWGEVKSGLIPAVSIGFRPKKYSYIEDGGVHFEESEVIELSLVTIPCQADAIITAVKSFGNDTLESKEENLAIQAVKSFDDAAIAALGVVVAKSVTKAVSNPPGVTGKNVKVKLNPSEGNEMNIREQIEAFEKALAEKTAAMTGIMEKSAESAETLDAAQAEQYDTLEQEVKALGDHITRLKKLEAFNVSKAKPVDNKTRTEFPTVTHVQSKAEKPVEAGIKFARYAMCLAAAQGNAQLASNIAKEHYPQSEDIIKTLEFQARGGKIDSMMKATVEAGTTLDTTWAAPLVDYQNFTGDFVEFLRPRTIIGRFGRDNIPSLNMIPFNVRITGQTSGGSASWVGEGAPKPLTKFDFEATELRWAKVASIAVITNELMRFSNPSAERLVRDALANAVIERIDLDFVDPAKVAVSNVSPGSITNGVTPVPSTGTDADGIRADLQALWAPFIAARNPPRNAVYIMDSTTALALSLMMNPLGQPEFPGIGINGGVFGGLPVIVSDYLPVDSSGSIVILANASDIWLADDGQVTINASREASLQMLDNPTNNSGTGTATSMVSMFQTNSTAILAERYINWQRRRLSGVSYLTGVNWG